MSIFVPPPPAIIRPVRPQDAGILQTFVRALAPKTRYLRFHTGMSELSPPLLEAMARLDRRRQQALIAVILGAGGDGGDGGETVIGEARYGVSPNDAAALGGTVAEIGIVVAEAWRRKGLATALLHALLDDARRAGIAAVYGEVLAENLATLRFARQAGFTARPNPDDRRLVRIEAALAGRAADAHPDPARVGNAGALRSPNMVTPSSTPIRS